MELPPLPIEDEGMIEEMLKETIAQNSTPLPMKHFGCSKTDNGYIIRHDGKVLVFRALSGVIAYLKVILS